MSTDGGDDPAEEYGEGLADGDDDRSIEFYGGRWMSALPLAIFVVWAVFQSGVLQIGDTTGLVAGMLYYSLLDKLGS